MFTLAAIIYMIMCFISNWDFLWPITMLIRGGIGDQAIAIVWGIILYAGLS